MKLKLSRVVESMMNFDVSVNYYYCKNSDFYGVINEYFENYSENDDELDTYEDRIYFPEGDFLDSYKMKRNFIFTRIEEEELGDKLFDIISYGKKRHQRFKQVLPSELLQNWYDFELESYKKLGIEWCQRNGYSFEDDI